MTFATLHLLRIQYSSLEFLDLLMALRTFQSLHAPPEVSKC
jgi:hypothetical protein